MHTCVLVDSCMLQLRLPRRFLLESCTAAAGSQRSHRQRPHWHTERIHSSPRSFSAMYSIWWFQQQFQLEIGSMICLLKRQPAILRSFCLLALPLIGLVLGSNSSFDLQICVLLREWQELLLYATWFSKYSRTRIKKLVQKKPRL